MIKEEFYRASHLCVCKICGKLYIEHPEEKSKEYLSYDGTPFLNRLCNGDLVKL